MEGVMVNGDVNLLRVVLENPLGNAWKYIFLGQKQAHLDTTIDTAFITWIVI
jgi:hypothetical protein